MVEISKADWKLFRERVPEWQELIDSVTDIGTNGFIVSAYPFRKDDL